MPARSRSPSAQGLPAPPWNTFKLTLSTGTKISMRFAINDGDWGMVVLRWESLDAPVTAVVDES
jgi:hypothetical protein